MKEEKDIKIKILDYLYNGHTQKEVFRLLKKDKPQKISDKKLKSLIKESAFLSPKNMRYATILYFLVTLIFPIMNIYIKGDFYRPLLIPILRIALALSFPFIFFGYFLFIQKDLKKILVISTAFVVYVTISTVILFITSIYINMWTISLFSIVIYPAVLKEYFKLHQLVAYIKEKKELN